MEALDEDTQLALALSLSEAAASSRKPDLQAACSTSPAEDEALARRLQQQYDTEQQLRQPLAASGTRLSPRLPPRPQPLLATADASSCAGCGLPLRRPGLAGMFSLASGSARYLTALGRSWHPACFRCTGCGQPLADSGQFSVSDQGLPYHPQCHKAQFHPRCDVCAEYLPTEGGNRIVWSTGGFWPDKACPAHATDGTSRCTACQRMQPRSEQWAELEDGCSLCLHCMGTVVVDTAACQPLYEEVLAFYREKGMPLPVRPPLMLVDDPALNAAERGETSGAGRGGGPVFHTRGLCLTEYSTTVRTVVRGAGLVPFHVGHRDVQIGPTRCEVTAILILYGLPRLLTGSILSHEAMHAFLRLSGYSGLAPIIEEGLCQLMALLWLESQQPQRAASGQQGAVDNGVAYEERLAAFLGHQIRTDPSVVYGDGLRAALDAFQRFGLQTMLAHVRRTGQLPS